MKIESIEQFCPHPLLSPIILKVSALKNNYRPNSGYYTKQSASITLFLLKECGSVSFSVSPSLHKSLAGILFLHPALEALFPLNRLDTRAGFGLSYNILLYAILLYSWVVDILCYNIFTSLLFKGLYVLPRYIWFNSICGFLKKIENFVLILWHAFCLMPD